MLRLLTVRPSFLETLRWLLGAHRGPRSELTNAAPVSRVSGKSATVFAESGSGNSQSRRKSSAEQRAYIRQIKRAPSAARTAEASSRSRVSSCRWTELTRIPSAAHSSATAFLNSRTPPLLGQYGLERGAPTRPEAKESVTF